MTSYNAHKLFAEIESVVKSDLPVTEGLQRVIHFCKRERPHADWDSLEALKVEEDLSRLREWLLAIMPTTPPPASVTGLWFGHFNPILEGRVTAELQVIGAPYSAESFNWIFRDRWGETNPYAESAVLDAIYQIAYGHKAGLRVDAEYPLCLVYANLAIRHLARTLGPELLRDAEQRVLNVGFNSGDFLCIGAIRKEGLVFSRKSGNMA